MSDHEHVLICPDCDKTPEELGYVPVSEVAKARHEGFLGAKVACSFNSDCNNCHANKLTLDYLVEPETAEVESNG